MGMIFCRLITHVFLFFGNAHAVPHTELHVEHPLVECGPYQNIGSFLEDWNSYAIKKKKKLLFYSKDKRKRFQWKKKKKTTLLFGKYYFLLIWIPVETLDLFNYFCDENSPFREYQSTSQSRIKTNTHLMNSVHNFRVHACTVIRNTKLGLFVTTPHRNWNSSSKLGIRTSKHLLQLHTLWTDPKELTSAYLWLTSPLGLGKTLQKSQKLLFFPP